MTAVQIAVFAPSEKGDARSKPFYVQKHRITSAAQTITVIVPHEPARAGIDPYILLIDWEPDDNVRTVQVQN